MIFQRWTAGESGLLSAPGAVETAREHLRAAALVGEDQEALRRRVLAFCDQHDDCLVRSCRTGHLTGSALVVDPSTNSTLLIHHAKLERWLQPGGHADGEGNLGAVAWQEATEETGLGDLVLVTPAIDIDIHAIPARPGEPEHLHLDLRYLVLAGPCIEPSPNHETLGARWLGGDDPILGTARELHRAVTRALTVAARLDVGAGA